MVCEDTADYRLLLEGNDIMTLLDQLFGRNQSRWPRANHGDPPTLGPRLIHFMLVSHRALNRCFSAEPS